MSAPERTALYRLYDIEHDLLYIGISRQPTKRFREHEHSQRWWHTVEYVDLTWFNSFNEARAAEKAAHWSERPPYNGLGHSGLGWDGPAAKYDDSADFAAIRGLILEALRAGTYKPGQHLWAMTLSRQLGYSRMTTDRAMGSLAKAGHLISRDAGFTVPERWAREHARASLDDPTGKAAS
jgi:hypothetical protein